MFHVLSPSDVCITLFESKSHKNNQSNALHLAAW